MSTIIEERPTVSQTTPYGLGVTVALPYDAAVTRVRDALAAEGFGVLTEIDVAATFKKKLDVDRPPYLILGACNPSLAHQALQLETDIGLLLPCNVIVYATSDPARSVVAALDPEAALQLTGRADIAPLAAEVKARLQRVLQAVSRAAA
jgi:uncharacterized protein (DUF302 family)